VRKRDLRDFAPGDFLFFHDPLIFVVAQSECDRGKFTTVQEIVQQFERIGIFTLFQPVDLMTFAFYFSEKNVLPFGKLTDFVE
jgi:hypothetical protein